MTEILTASQFRALRKEAEKKNKPTKKKPEVSAHTKALKKADAEHSLWFRANEANEQGAVQCVTCGHWMMWKTSDGSTHCGHYESRGFAATRFMPENCGVQCRACNYYLEGAKIKFRAYLVKRHGEEKVLEIEKLAKMPNKRLTDFELDEIIKERKTAREKLVKLKGLV
jgi:hypothetical protein